MVDKPLKRSSHGPLCHPLGGSISLGLFHCRQATGEKGCHARTDSKSSSSKARGMLKRFSPLCQGKPGVEKLEGA